MKSRPNVFKSAMNLVVDKLDPPSHRISGDGKRAGVFGSSHRHTKLVGSPRFNLRFCVVQHTVAEIVANDIDALTFCMVYPTPRGLISHF